MCPYSGAAIAALYLRRLCPCRLIAHQMIDLRVKNACARDSRLPVPGHSSSRVKARRTVRAVTLHKVLMKDGSSQITACTRRHEMARVRV